MKKKLSSLIDLAKQPETYLNDQEVMDLIGSGKEIKISKARFYRPNRIRRFFIPLILIVMTALVVVISSILLLSPAKDIPNTKGPIDSLPKARTVVAANVASPASDTSQEVNPQKLIPQSPVKSKLKIKSEKPKKEQSLKVADTRRIISVAEGDSIVSAEAERLIETQGLGVKPIELDSATLRCIGLNISDGSIEILWEDTTYHCYRSNRYFQGITARSIAFTTQAWALRTASQLAGWKMKPVKFIALSSRGENKPVTRRQNLYGYQLDPASFDILLNASIPIAIKGYNSAEKYMKVIFWLVPTVELINCLPDSIAVPMRKEFNRNIKPILAGLTEKNGKPVKIDTPQNVFSAEELANPVPCQYFPSFCEGLPGLDNLRVYPIPTSDFLNIEILLLQSKKITYRLFDISGRVLNDKLPTKDYTVPGQYTEKLDLSGLNPGLYLLVLTDNEGARMTRRILKN